MSSLKRLLLSRNVGTADRVLRILPAVVSVWAWTQGMIAGPVAIALGVVSLMLLVTSLTGSCSIYAMLGVSTRRDGASKA